MLASQAAYVASARFGLGPRAGELAEIGSDPRGWALQQVAGPPPTAPANTKSSGAARMRAFLEIRQNRGDKGVEELLRREWRETYIRDASARLRTQIETRVPFRERLVVL
jgi:uncharacterized protein (DUF1800 family)